MDSRAELPTSALQQRVCQLSSLCTHLLQSSEIEKSLLARTLHDELGGLLVATKMDIVWLRRKFAEGDAATRAHWDRVLQSLEQAIDCKRRVIENLRPSLLDNLGLVAALRWLIDESCRETGLQSDQRFPEEAVTVGAQPSIALFRVVQEALTNVIRHAHASRVLVEMTLEPTSVVLLIRDDGVGISLAQLQSDDSHGIAGMSQRIQALQGELTVTPSASGRGTTVLARVPRASFQGVS
jgi:signal transduction histidine kinase